MLISSPITPSSRQLICADQDNDSFWLQVKTNLQAGRIRMVILADTIPAELLRIVEFLNEQMDPAEVLAIEVKQFVGKGVKTLVPRVMGQTETARQKKTSSTAAGKQWNEASFFETLQSKRGADETNVAQTILNWATKNGLRIWWGKGDKDGSFFPVYDGKFGKNFLFSVWTYGRVELQFQHMKKPPFEDDSMRWELAQRISAVTQVTFTKDVLGKRPTFGLGLLVNSDWLGRFLSTFDWALAEIKKIEQK